MAIAFVQTAKSIIENQSNVTVTWSTAPTVGNLIIVGVVYDSDRTLILPPDETDGWTTRVAEIPLGSDSGGRVIRIDTAIVGSGTDTSWFWDITPNDILGIIAIEVSGADIGGTLKTEQVENTTPIAIDGDTNPSGEMIYFILTASKTFGTTDADPTGQTVITWTNTDSSMTDDGGDTSESGTNWAMNGWHEILDGARPTASITFNDSGSGSGVLLGIPVASSGLAITPSAITVTVTPGSQVVTTGSVGLTPDPITVTVTPGSAVLTTTFPVAPTGASVTVTPGSQVITVGSTAITPDPITVTVTPGSVVVAVDADFITPDPITVTVTPGSQVVTVGSVAVVPDAIQVTVTPGSMVLTTSVPVDPGGASVTVTTGSVVLTTGSVGVTPAPITVTVTPGGTTTTQPGVAGPAGNLLASEGTEGLISGG